MTNDDSVDTLLKMKKNIELLQSVLNEISNCKINTNNNYEEKMNSIIDMYNQVFDDNFINSISTDLKMITNKVNMQIHITCDHDLEEDYIDTFPERSIRICYCKKCYLTMY